MSENSEDIKASVAAMREEYGAQSLRRVDLADDPIDQFDHWFKQARDLDIIEPNAMSLATIGSDGFPASRMVLMKSFDAKGFVFFTNYGSAKAGEIASIPKVSLLFPWLEIERQVRIEGVVEKISEKESEHYFSSRPRQSQLGAWVSDQSSIVESRSALTKEWEEVTAKYEGGDVPMPPLVGRLIV